MKLKKIQAEDWEAGTSAKYAVVGHEHIQLTKVRERYHYNGRDGWGHYGSREVWKCEGLNRWIRKTRTRKELVNNIKACLEEDAS
tara:strand:+ start:389 stop:643 length:255 start_codon:yes stop_codon:yes gene_type:complete